MSHIRNNQWVVLRRIQRLYENPVGKSAMVSKQRLPFLVWVPGFHIASVGERKRLWDVTQCGATHLGSAQSGKLQLS